MAVPSAVARGFRETTGLGARVSPYQAWDRAQKTLASRRGSWFAARRRETKPMPIRVTAEQLHAMVQEAILQLPPRFRAALEVVPVRICDRPTPAQLQSVGLDESELLLGLYEGVPLTLRSVNDGPRVPDRISLFHEDLEDACDSVEQLREEVRITLFHELGHYFGFDEDELDALGYG
jgi:predicted Zn-dependent protease with MMP-like domain